MEPRLVIAFALMATIFASSAVGAVAWARKRRRRKLRLRGIKTFETSR